MQLAAAGDFMNKGKVLIEWEDVEKKKKSAVQRWCVLTNLERELCGGSLPACLLPAACCLLLAACACLPAVLLCVRARLRCRFFCPSLPVGLFFAFRSDLFCVRVYASLGLSVSLSLCPLPCVSMCVMCGGGSQRCALTKENRISPVISPVIPVSLRIRGYHR
jgi:hypothetical protein